MLEIFDVEMADDYHGQEHMFASLHNKLLTKQTCNISSMGNDKATQCYEH